MSQNKGESAIKMSRGLKIENGVNRDAYGARVGTRDDVTKA